MHTPRRNPVYRALNKPLLLLGVERTLFFTAASTGMLFFILFSNIFGALAIFAVLTVMAKLATKKDPQMLLFLFLSARYRAEYDPWKYAPPRVRRSGA